MFCKHCGEKIDDNAAFCSKCGANLKATVESNVEAAPTVVNSNGENTTFTKKGISPKTIRILDGSLLGGMIAGAVGAFAFLIIVLVGVIVYGRVYLFDGYDFTKVLSIISIILMMIGLCSAVAKLILSWGLKICKFPTIIKRILIIGLAVICLSFSIWGFVDAANSNYDYNYSGGDYYGGVSNTNSLYDAYNKAGCRSPWATYNSSYIKIDTNPYDISGSTTYASQALTAIKTLNNIYNVPGYVYDDMLKTRAIDGRQSYSNNRILIYWRYHPDSGLEVTYALN